MSVNLSVCTQGLRDYFASLVHESARRSPLVASRHQAFITSHLVGGFTALAVFPVYLASIGQPTILTAFAFAWLMTPILIAVFLSKTGKIRIAHLISAINLAGVVTIAAGLTGGVTSFLIAWMVVVPLEAALSADRRVVFASISVTVVALLGLAASQSFALLPEPQAFSYTPVLLAVFGTLSALVYAGGLAISVQTVYEQSEHEILKGEQRYRLLAQNATDMITRHDARGQVLFASTASEQILGQPACAIEGNGLLNKVHVSDRPEFLMAFSQCMKRAQPVSVELRLQVSPPSSSGGQDEPDYRWVEMRCKPVICDEEGDAIAHAREIVAVTRDISARKEQEDEILMARDAAESANRAKTQFLANMSHELRTPLNAIIGFSEILVRELYGRIGEDRYREYANLIHESGEHLLSVVNEVLDMSKIEAGRFDIVTEHFDLRALIKLCCEIMGAQAGKKSITIDMNCDPDLPELLADKRACKQILLNLLANAIKFTEESGSVMVNAVRLDAEIEISVADNGIGIAEQDISKLGNPFVQAESSYDRSYEGAGLGLSVVKGLVRLHGGDFKIESQLGEGTRVSIRLPIDGQSETAPDTAQAGGNRDENDGIKIAV